MYLGPEWVCGAHFQVACISAFSRCDTTPQPLVRSYHAAVRHARWRRWSSTRRCAERLDPAHHWPLREAMLAECAGMLGLTCTRVHHSFGCPPHALHPTLLLSLSPATASHPAPHAARAGERRAGGPVLHGRHPGPRLPGHALQRHLGGEGLNELGHCSAAAGASRLLAGAGRVLCVAGILSKPLCIVPRANSRRPGCCACLWARPSAQTMPKARRRQRHCCATPPAGLQTTGCRWGGVGVLAGGAGAQPGAWLALRLAGMPPKFTHSMKHPCDQPFVSCRLWLLSWSARRWSAQKTKCPCQQQTSRQPCSWSATQGAERQEHPKSWLLQSEAAKKAAAAASCLNESQITHAYI